MRSPSSVCSQSAEGCEYPDRTSPCAYSGAEAGASPPEAAANVTEFGNVDRRARDYLQSGQTLMAG